jgi:hypothetical protein
VERRKRQKNPTKKSRETSHARQQATITRPFWMFKVLNVVQHIMSELNESVSEEGKIVAITKIVMKLLNNEH